MHPLIANINLNQANVFGIYGNLGGGKSLTSVCIMLEFLRRGWRVDSNIRLFLPDDLSPLYRYIENIDGFDPWEFVPGAPRGSSDPTRSCVVIDECAEFFDQYSGNSPVVRNFLSWLRHSSKRGQFVFLIVQQPEFLQKSLRLLIRGWIKVDDLAVLRVPVVKIRFPFCSDLVWARIFDRMGNYVSRGFITVSKTEFGGYYDTAQSIATQGRRYDYKPSAATSPTSDPFFWIMLICSFITLI